MIIGITGGIGSGKSKVAACWSFFFKLQLLDLDDLCRQLLKKGHPGWLAIERVFGRRFFLESGELDRIAFRNALFGDRLLRKEVDSLLHPLARASMHNAVKQGVDSVILAEIPLLFEAGWEQDVHAVVVVYADQDTRCQRIMDRDGVSVNKGRRAIAAQASLEEKVMAADHVIENSGAWARTSLQIIRLGHMYEQD